MPVPLGGTQEIRGRDTLLDAAEALFYQRGIHAVGMDAIRDSAKMPLKRIYALFATKEDLVVAVLHRRDRQWRDSLAEHVQRYDDPRERVLSIFDWLEQWFAEPGFRGCAWINAYGELGANSPAVLAEVRTHKHAFHEQVTAWVTAATDASAEPVCLMAEGAIVTAAITGDTKVARAARAATAVLLG